MQVHNPSRQSRRCQGLGETLDPFQVRDISDDETAAVQGCPECWCTILDQEPAEPAKAKSEAGEK